MKRIVFPVSALFILLFGSSFIFPNQTSDEVRKLKSFDGIGIGVHADVFYTQGASHEIRIEGDERDVKDLVTEIENGFLRIKYDNYRIRHQKLVLYITSSELESVKISGSGKFNVEKPLTSDEMELAVSGSGDIWFSQLISDEVGVKISGSGSIKLEKGSADELDVKISGSGALLAEGFEVSECSAAISGSGNVRITANDELEARLSGSGKIYYRGDPQVNSQASGSGKAIAL